VTGNSTWKKKCYEDGSEYEGEFVGVKWHGLGRLQIRDEEEYYGEWLGAGMWHFRLC